MIISTHVFAAHDLVWKVGTILNDNVIIVAKFVRREQRSRVHHTSLGTHKGKHSKVISSMYDLRHWLASRFGETNPCCSRSDEYIAYQWHSYRPRELCCCGLVFIKEFI